MHAYSTAGWENFFVAEVGAAAALTGLLFVAVSINLARILENPQLPGRAGESLVMLMNIVALASLGLVPGQSNTALGAEVLAVSLIAWIFPMTLQARTRMEGTPRRWLWTRVATHQVATLPLLTAGVSLLALAGGGLYWLAAGTVLTFAGSVVNAWVLLIEIQR